jgi:hypothetical protein
LALERRDVSRSCSRREYHPVSDPCSELELIEQLVRRDRTAVSSALLAIAGIGASEALRGAVLAQVSEAARWAQAEGAISAERGGQIARHVTSAQDAGVRVAP